MHEYKIKRNPDGTLAENCPENIGVKIGSFDCTANCPCNQNTNKEIHTYGFDLPFVRCEAITTKNNQQLIFEI